MVVCFVFFPALVVALKHRRWRRSPDTMINHNLKQRAILSASEPTPLHFLSTISTQLTIYQKIQLRCFSRIMLTLKKLFSPFCFFIFFHSFIPTYLLVRLLTCLSISSYRFIIKKKKASLHLAMEETATKMPENQEKKKRQKRQT